MSGYIYLQDKWLFDFTNILHLMYLFWPLLTSFSVNPELCGTKSVAYDELVVIKFNKFCPSVDCAYISNIYREK